MAGYAQVGVDLDSKFMARVSAKRADVGYQIGGVDISNRYEQIGTGTPIAATGYRSVGNDLAAYFRNINQPLVTVVSITAGVYFTVIGFVKDTCGAASPATYRGLPINGIYQGPDANTFSFSLFQTGMSKNYFTSIVINGRTYLSANTTSFENTAAYAYTTWLWTPNAGLANGGVYTVTIT
jgi:hypothetical protein